MIQRQSRYARLKAAGICVLCEHRPARPRHVICTVCTAVQNARGQLRNRARRLLGQAMALYRFHPSLPLQEPLALSEASEVSCCNQTHHVPAVPFTLPCCGYLVDFAKEGAC